MPSHQPERTRRIVMTIVVAVSGHCCSTATALPARKTKGEPVVEHGGEVLVRTALLAPAGVIYTRDRHSTHICAQRNAQSLTTSLAAKQPVSSVGGLVTRARGPEGTSPKAHNPPRLTWQTSPMPQIQWQCLTYEGNEQLRTDSRVLSQTAWSRSDGADLAWARLNETSSLTAVSFNLARQGRSPAAVSLDLVC
jgi:hypothetical protein